MADFISFNEGRKELANNGLPATCYFLLSTKDCTTLLVTDTLAGGVAEITGTGYARQSQSEPTATAANPSAVVFTQMTWSTGSATNWPAGTKAVLLVTTSDNTGKAICGWNLVTGGTARDLSAASTTENVTPTLNVA